jgi:hypothetical protein
MEDGRMGEWWMNKSLIIPYLARRGQKKAALAPRDRYQVEEAILKKGGASSIPRLWKIPSPTSFSPSDTKKN